MLRAARSADRRKLANKFILVSNIEASDGGKAIVAGNERVIRARLSDAKFFYETDLKTRLEDRLPKFEQIVFHEKLGTQAERIARIEQLAAELAPLVGADVEKAKRAARLGKADLLTEVVGEFPELQGLMGKYYALAQGEDEAVAAACEDHYKPLGPDDRVPTDPVSIAVALADKIDTLVGFWAIDEKPTGSKDPYALRRAALGVIRIIARKSASLQLIGAAIDRIRTWRAFARHADDSAAHRSEVTDARVKRGHDARTARSARLLRRPPEGPAARAGRAARSGRCGVRARRPGRSAADRPPRRGARQIPRHRRRQEPARRLQARDQHPPHRGEEGQRELYRRARSASSISQEEEQALAEAIDAAKTDASAAVAREDFAAAMRAMAKLRPHVDAFFDKVTVNVDEPRRCARTG